MKIRTAQDENVTTNQSVLKYSFKIDLSEYAKRFGVNIPNDSADTLTDEDDADSNSDAQDEMDELEVFLQSCEDESPDVVDVEDATVSYAPGFAPGSLAGQCQATLQQCKAKNPMTCRYHGAQVIANDIESSLRNAGITGKVDVKLQGVTNVGGKQILSVEATVQASSADQKSVDAAMAQFFKNPGVDGDTQLIGFGRNEYTAPFDIDMLDPQAKAKWGLGQSASQQTTQTPAPAPAQPQPAPVSQPAQPVQTPSAQAPASTPSTSGSASSIPPMPQGWSKSFPNNPTLSKMEWIYEQAAKNGIIKLKTKPSAGINSRGDAFFTHLSQMTDASRLLQLMQADPAANALNLATYSYTGGFGVYTTNQLAKSQPTAPASAQQPQSSVSTQPVQQPTPQSPSTPVPAPAAKPSGATRVAAIKGINSIREDKKALKALSSAGGSKKACDDIKKLIEDKEQVLADAKSMKVSIKGAPKSLVPGYKKIYDGLAKKAKDLSDRIDDAIDAETKAVQQRANSAVAAGDTASDLKAKFQAMKAAGKIKYVPAMLDAIDSKVETKEANLRKSLTSHIPEIADDTKWETLKSLVTQSLAAYLDKCAYRTYCGANTILDHFIDKEDYDPSTSKGFNSGYYGVTDMKERGTCCSATILNHDPFDVSIQSAWDGYRSDRSCVLWKKSTTAIAYNCTNLGSAGGGSSWSRGEQNGSLITNPSITSLGYMLGAGYWGSNKKTINWCKDLLKAGKPDLTIDRAKAKDIFSHGADHDECHAFSGNAGSKDILNHIEAFEFKQQTAAAEAVRRFGPKLKKFGIKILWGSNRTEIPNP